MPSKGRTDSLHSASLNNKTHGGFMVSTEVPIKSSKPPWSLQKELGIFIFVRQNNGKPQNMQINLLAAVSLKKHTILLLEKNLWENKLVILLLTAVSSMSPFTLWHHFQKGYLWQQLRIISSNRTGVVICAETEITLLAESGLPSLQPASPHYTW